MWGTAVKCFSILLLVASLCNGHSVLASTINLVSNPGWETGDFTGWALSGNNTYRAITTIDQYVHSGKYGLIIGPVGTHGFISQDIPTAIGNIYTVSFWWESFGGPTNDFNVSFGDQLLVSMSNFRPVKSYHQYSYDVIADSAISTLKFDVRQDPKFQGIDDVVVSDNGSSIVTPLPSTAFMGIALMGGLGIVHLIRRKMAVLAPAFAATPDSRFNIINDRRPSHQSARHRRD